MTTPLHIVTVEPAAPTLSPGDQAWCLLVWRTAWQLRRAFRTSDRTWLIVRLCIALDVKPEQVARVRWAVAWLERCGHLRQTAGGWEIHSVGAMQEAA